MPPSRITLLLFSVLLVGTGHDGGVDQGGGVGLGKSWSPGQGAPLKSQTPHPGALDVFPHLPGHTLNPPRKHPQLACYGKIGFYSSDYFYYSIFSNNTLIYSILRHGVLPFLKLLRPTLFSLIFVSCSFASIFYSLWLNSVIFQVLILLENFAIFAVACFFRIILSLRVSSQTYTFLPNPRNHDLQTNP